MTNHKLLQGKTTLVQMALIVKYEKIFISLESINFLVFNVFSEDSLWRKYFILRGKIEQYLRELFTDFYLLNT